MISPLYSLAMLIGLPLAIYADEPAMSSFIAFVALAFATVRRRAWGLPNRITWLRIVATSCLASMSDGLGAAILALAIFSADGLDGLVARRTNSESAFGAELDSECDAFFVLSMCWVLWTGGIAGAWIFIPGAWRYAYRLVVEWAPEMKPAPRSQLARYTFSFSSSCMMLAILCGAPWGAPLGMIASAAISASFIRSLVYGLR